MDDFSICKLSVLCRYHGSDTHEFLVIFRAGTYLIILSFGT